MIYGLVVLSGFVLYLFVDSFTTAGEFIRLEQQNLDLRARLDNLDPEVQFASKVRAEAQDKIDAFNNKRRLEQQFRRARSTK